jgi:hypothetical protein
LSISREVYLRVNGALVESSNGANEGEDDNRELHFGIGVVFGVWFWVEKRRRGIGPVLEYINFGKCFND